MLALLLIGLRVNENKVVFKNQNTTVTQPYLFCFCPFEKLKPVGEVQPYSKSVNYQPFAIV
jgi:hypothetical protein